MSSPVHLFAALGFTSTVGQILLMRVLIVVFYGNEVSLGIILAAWLFWVGLGSLLAARVVPRFKLFGRPPVLTVLQVLLGLATLGALLCVRALPLVLRRASAGEIVGYVPIVVSSLYHPGGAGRQPRPRPGVRWADPRRPRDNSVNQRPPRHPRGPRPAETPRHQ